MASPTTERSGTDASKVVDYVRENDAEDVGRDMRAEETYPWASLLVMGAVVVGGSLLVAAMLRDDERAGASGQSRSLMGLASASSGLGPKATATLSRIRDAAFSFVLDKAVATVEELFPGFREHYERA